MNGEGQGVQVLPMTGAAAVAAVAAPAAAAAEYRFPTEERKSYKTDHTSHVTRHTSHLTRR